MSDIPWIATGLITQEVTLTDDLGFHTPVKHRGSACAPAVLEIDAKYKPGLMALEIAEVQACR
jgi:hypothetical protein